MKGTQIITAVILLFLGGELGAQVPVNYAPGLEPVIRFSDAYVGTTTSLQITSNTYNIDPFFMVRGYFSASLPQHFKGTIQADAGDPSIAPSSITLHTDQKISDYVIGINGGILFPKSKQSGYWVFLFGVQFVMRYLEITPLEPYNAGIYILNYDIRNPYIPGALSLGKTIGIGYHHSFKKTILFPRVSFGFGSEVTAYKQNSFPNYMELSIGFMIPLKRRVVERVIDN